jgi:DNA polymerase I-like protein with 3'-5' exonuclease and polymerase domains
VPRHKHFNYTRWAEHTTASLQEDAPPLVAFDTETTGLGYYDQPFAATLSWRTPDGRLRNGYYDLEGEGREDRLVMLNDALLSTPAWVGHNLKFDLQKGLLCGAFTWADIKSRTMQDSQTAFYLLNENDPRGLKPLAVKFLSLDDTITRVYKSGKQKGQAFTKSKQDYKMEMERKRLGLTKDDGYHLLDRKVLIPYALADTDFTLRLYELFMPRLEELGLLDIYRAELDTSEVFLRIEADGFQLDMPYLQAKASEYGVRVMKAYAELVKLSGRADFNPDSWQQIQAYYKKRGITIENTQAQTLEALDDDFARLIVQHRQDSKIHKTYLLGLLKEQKDGLVMPWFNPLGARTGRTSSGGAKE